MRLRKARETEEYLAPLRRELADVEDKIREMERNIAQAKTAVLTNDARILELARMVVFK